MIINHRHRFIFYHVPKAAGSSIRTALLAVDGSRTKPKTMSKHVTPKEYLDRVNWFQRWRVKEYFSFCFVRDPFERFGSAHRYTMQRGRGARHNPDASVNEFAEMLDAGVEWVVGMPSMRPQLDHAVHVDFVGRYENLDEDFAKVCKTIGIGTELAHLNQSGPQRRYLDEFTQKTVDILTNFYQEDFKRLGYAVSPTKE